MEMGQQTPSVGQFVNLETAVLNYALNLCKEGISLMLKLR